jgi:restriction endonuclease Mrr
MLVWYSLTGPTSAPPSWSTRKSANMSLPRLPSITTQFFYLLSDGQEHPKNELFEALVALYRLSRDELGEATKSGRSKFGNLVDWAQADLVRAILIEEIRPQVLTLTDEGRDLAAHRPDRIDRSFLARKYWTGG